MRVLASSRAVVRPLQITGLWDLLHAEQKAAGEPVARASPDRSSRGPSLARRALRGRLGAAADSCRTTVETFWEDHRARRGHLRAAAHPGRGVRRRRCATCRRTSSRRR